MVPKSGKYMWLERDFGEDKDEGDDGDDGEPETNGEGKGKAKAKKEEDEDEKVPEVVAVPEVRVSVYGFIRYRTLALGIRSNGQ